MNRAEALVIAAGPRWTELALHPFVVATADGTLAEAAFDLWLLDDHAFVVQFCRFLAGGLVLAPDERSRDVLAAGLAALTPEIALFRAELAGRGLDPARHAPSTACTGYGGWMLGSLVEGYEVALAVAHGVERAYLDAWSAVRQRSVGGRYEAFVENWSSPAFAAWVDALAGLLGEGTPTAAQRSAYRQVAEFEHSFWDAVSVG